jgi:NAD(P)H-flavin reductase
MISHTLAVMTLNYKPTDNSVLNNLTSLTSYRIKFIASLANDFIHVRFEVFTAVTMKNGVFLNIKTQFVLHRRHITSPLQSPGG